MTEELFREDATLDAAARPRVLAVDAAGIRLDRTVFYPQGGGQAGDAGVLRLADGRELRDRRHAQERCDAGRDRARAGADADAVGAGAGHAR